MAIKVLAWKALTTTFAGKRHENLEADDVLRASLPQPHQSRKLRLAASSQSLTSVSPILGSLVALHAERIGAAATFVGLEDPRTHLFSGEGTLDGIWRDNKPTTYAIGARFERYLHSANGAL
ncbi:hypothetical protein E4U10_004974 [Claviceps purpurea]|nr:hypothetical protein E4U10_004974 [Claviceps purpurea]